MSHDDTENRPKHASTWIKIVILVQAAITLSFAVGMYQEYINNAYLRQYVIDLFASNIVADTTLSIISASVFAIGTFTLLGSMRTGKKRTSDWTVARNPPPLDMPVMPPLQTIEKAPESQGMNQRPRRRRPKISADDLYESMNRYAADRERA